MASIDPQIDAAVVLMKERAAKHDNWTMDDVTFGTVMVRADMNLARAMPVVPRCLRDDWTPDPVLNDMRRRNLTDCMNLCALALSLLPDDAAQKEES